MRKNLFKLMSAAVLLAACALPKPTLLPLEATLGRPLDVTLYHVPT